MRGPLLSAHAGVWPMAASRPHAARHLPPSSPPDRMRMPAALCETLPECVFFRIVLHFGGCGKSALFDHGHTAWSQPCSDPPSPCARPRRRESAPRSRNAQHNERKPARAAAPGPKGSIRGGTAAVGAVALRRAAAACRFCGSADPRRAGVRINGLCYHRQIVR